MDTIWMPKASTEEYGEVYVTEYAGLTEGESRGKLYFDFVDDDDLNGDTVDENLEQLGWELVELKITEV